MGNELDHLQSTLSDRYVIDREIGSGGMAVVYLAEDLKHHRKVALKVLRPELAAAIGSERFVREIEIAATSAIRSSCPCTTRVKQTAACSVSCRMWTASH